MNTWTVEGQVPDVVYIHSSGARVYRWLGEWVVRVGTQEHALPRQATLAHAEHVIARVSARG